MRIQDRLQTLLVRLTPGKSRTDKATKNDRKERSHARGRSEQDADTDVREPSRPRVRSSWGDALRSAFGPGRGAIAGVRTRCTDLGAASPTAETQPGRRLASPTQRLEFERGILDTELLASIDPAAIDSHQLVLIKRLGERVMQRVSPQQAREVVRHNYQQVKGQLLREAREQGLDLRRLAFDDAACAIEMEHGVFEVSALFPKTFGAYLPKLVEKPQNYEHNGTHWLTRVPKDNSETNFRDYVVEARRSLAEAQQARPKHPPQGSTVDKLVIRAIRGNKGLVIGESHREAAPRNLLIQSMPTLKSQGVTTLYMEHVTDSLQEVLDDYARAKPGSSMPRDLALYMAARDSNLTTKVPFGDAQEATALGAPLGQVIEAAQAHGIRVVAIDTDSSYAHSFAASTDSSASRILAMNYEGMRKIQQQTNGKWVALVGSAHVHAAHVQHQGRPSETIPGLAEVTGAAALTVEDASGTKAVLSRNEKVPGQLSVTLESVLKLPVGFDGKTPINAA